MWLKVCQGSQVEGNCGRGKQIVSWSETMKDDLELHKNEFKKSTTNCEMMCWGGRIQTLECRYNDNTYEFTHTYIQIKFTYTHVRVCNICSSAVLLDKN